MFSGLRRARRDVLHDVTETWTVGNEKRSVLRSGPGSGTSNGMEQQAGISQFQMWELSSAEMSVSAVAMLLSRR